jgi:hypothetical protein
MILISNRIYDATNDNTNGNKEQGNNCDDHLAPNNLHLQLSLSERITILKIRVQLVS